MGSLSAIFCWPSSHQSGHHSWFFLHESRIFMVQPFCSSLQLLPSLSPEHQGGQAPKNTPLESAVHCHPAAPLRWPCVLASHHAGFLHMSAFQAAISLSLWLWASPGHPPQAAAVQVGQLDIHLDFCCCHYHTRLALRHR